tara:strand:+ start:105 stop:512 length:408 start_codon:yes stop_codon:yes gene_type:complete
MKSSLLVTIIFLFSLNAYSQCRKINFINTSLSYAYDKAQQEDKSIFVFLYEENDPKANFFQSAIFYKNEVCSVFNEKFINVKARKDSQIGSEIINQNQIIEFPCFIILDKYRNLKFKSNTILNSMELIRFAERDG